MSMAAWMSREDISDEIRMRLLAKSRNLMITSSIFMMSNETTRTPASFYDTNAGRTYFEEPMGCGREIASKPESFSQYQSTPAKYVGVHASHLHPIIPNRPISWPQHHLHWTKVEALARNMMSTSVRDLRRMSLRKKTTRSRGHMYDGC